MSIDEAIKLATAVVSLMTAVIALLSTERALNEQTLPSGNSEA